MVGRSDPPRPAGAGLVRLGVGAAAVMAFALAALWAVTTPPFAAIDEAAHVGYAITLADGELPTLETLIPARDVPGLADWLDRQILPNPHRLVVWTSNHPPLAYALLAPSAAWAAGGSLAGLVAMRLTMAACLAAAVAATGWLAREVAPSRPSAALVAAAALAVAPPLVQHSGLVFTDVVLVALGTATLAGATRVLRRGPSPGLVAVVAVAATAAALSRATGVIIAGLAVLAVGVAGWREAASVPGADPRRRAVRIAAPVAVTVTVGGAWFYLRNWALMGDPTGAGALLELADRQPRTSVWPALLNPWKWSEWARYQLELMLGAESSLWPLAALLAGIGVVAGAAALAVRRAGGLGALRATLRRDPPLAWAWAMLAALVVVCGVSMVQWWTEGGNAHARYLYPAAPVLAVAVGLVASAWPIRRVAGLVVTGGILATVALIVDFGFAASAPGAVAAGAGVALVAAAVVVAAAAGLDRESPRPAPPPSAARQGARSR